MRWLNLCGFCLRPGFGFPGDDVMVDSDLAELYDVETSSLNRAVKRNMSRFPKDFMFQLKPKEWDGLTFQNGISSAVNRGGRRYLPYVFTEHGIAMLSSVLNSDQAAAINVQIMRAFVRMRKLADGSADLRTKLIEMEKTYDSQFTAIFGAIKRLMEPPVAAPKRRMGFPLAKV